MSLNLFHEATVEISSFNVVLLLIDGYGITTITEVVRDQKPRPHIGRPPTESARDRYIHTK